MPSVRSSASHAEGSVASPTLNLPATVESGDLLIMFFTVDSDQTVTWDNSSHGTWTQEYVINAGNFGAYCYVKVADGTEDGGTLNPTLGVADQTKSVCYAIQDWFGTLPGVVSATNTDGSTATPNPPAVDTGETEDTLFIAVAHGDNNSAITTYPANYTGNQVVPNDGLGACTIAAATRSLTGDGSDDPGAFTFGTIRVMGSATVAVRSPAAGGASVTINLVDIDSSVQANLSNLRWDWFNEPDPQNFNAPSDQGTVETTDGTGELVLDLTNTTLTTGQTGFLVLRDATNNFIGGYRLDID